VLVAASANREAAGKFLSHSEMYEKKVQSFHGIQDGTRQPPFSLPRVDVRPKSALGMPLVGRIEIESDEWKAGVGGKSEIVPVGEQLQNAIPRSLANSDRETQNGLVISNQVRPRIWILELVWYWSARELPCLAASPPRTSGNRL